MTDAFRLRAKLFMFVKSLPAKLLVEFRMWVRVWMFFENIEGFKL